MTSARGSGIASPEPFVVTVKQQVAIVRTLADELERFLVHDDSVAWNLREQLVQELAQLGQRTLEAAVAMSQDAARAPSHALGCENALITLSPAPAAAGRPAEGA